MFAVSRFSALRPSSHLLGSIKTVTRQMGSFTEGVDFDTLAVEWRCKWSPDNDKKSLAEAQKALNAILPAVKALDGVKKVDRVVCGACSDFKVITSMPAGEKFDAWKEAGFAPQEEFLAKLKEIDGISTIETQIYTLMPM